MNTFAMIWALIGGAVVVGTLTLLGAGVPWLPALAGLLAAGLVYGLRTRRDRRHRALEAEPFPESWRAILEEWVDFYRDLEPVEQSRFEREVYIFLDEQTITGPQGAEVDDELRVLVAASAIVVVFGRRGFRYPRLRDIVIYAKAFDENYREGSKDANVLGMVHAQGPILFSARSLKQGFRGEHDGHNVGYHEFAHVLDFDGGRADGIPGFMPWSAIRPWLNVMHDEAAKVKERRSLLRRYAATNEAEFFAVATEMFFEKPKRLRKEHSELYELLRDAYGQDPAQS